MRNIFFLIVVVLSVLTINSQELKCVVSINDDKIPNSNKQVFRTLEKSILEFLNQTKWTDKNVKPHEKINCAFTIIINRQEAPNRFEASIQVQSTRPIFGSTYNTPILNIRDNNLNFRYTEFDPLIYNANSFDSNLLSTLVFYVYTILGVDADTFKMFGGEKYLKEAERVMLNAQQSGILAWSNQVGKINRFLLIDNLLDAKLKQYRVTMYNYHRLGLDKMSDGNKEGKQVIESSIIAIKNIYKKTISNYLIRLFFDAKAEEIVSIYSGGNITKQKEQLVKNLKEISPNNSRYWRKID